jgi:hypothetical protein
MSGLAILDSWNESEEKKRSQQTSKHREATATDP